MFCFVLFFFRQVRVPAHDQCVPAAQHDRAACWLRVQQHHRPVRLSGRALPETRPLLQVPASPGVPEVLRDRRPVCGRLHRQTYQWEDVLRAASPASFARAASSSYPPTTCSSYTYGSRKSQPGSATAQTDTVNSKRTCTCAASAAGIRWTQTPFPTG